MDSYFRLLRAHEEIDRLNVEIRRVATHLRDEDQYLCRCEETSRLTDPSLAHQIGLHRMLRGQFKAHHEHCLKGISKIVGFSGTITPGASMDTSEGASVFLPANQSLPPSPVLSHPSAEERTSSRAAEMENERVELEQEADEEEEDEALTRDILDVLSVSVDGMQLEA